MREVKELIHFNDAGHQLEFRFLVLNSNAINIKKSILHAT